MVPKCNIWNEEYHVVVASPDVYICTGRAWIATDPSTSIYLRVHQRITAVFRWVDGTPRCCHIHISNPYSEMTQKDVGFPTQMGQHTYSAMQTNMAQDRISVSMGISWRRRNCNIKEQFDEADRLMYRAKAAFYSSSTNDRRRR